MAESADCKSSWKSFRVSLLFMYTHLLCPFDIFTSKQEEQSWESEPRSIFLQHLSLTFKILFLVDWRTMTCPVGIVLSSTSSLLLLVHKPCRKGERNGEGEVDLYVHLFSLFSMHCWKNTDMYFCVNGEGWIQEAVSQPEGTVADQEDLSTQLVTKNNRVERALTLLQGNGCARSPQGASDSADSVQTQGRSSL